MEKIKTLQISHEEARQLALQMIRDTTPNYVIQDTLVARGYSATRASRLIRELRQSEMTVIEWYRHMSSITFGLFIVLVVILAALMLLITLMN